MVACDQRDLVCLHLDVHDEGGGRSPAPSAVTAAGIGDALELGDTAADRVQLLEDLGALEEAGLVRSVERPVDGRSVPRTTYALTTAGREHAAEVRERVREGTVVVTDGTSEEVPLAEIERFFEDATAPLVRALARRTDDGRVPLERHVGDAFVDREAPLSTVETAIEDSFTRESRTVAVTGASGMGKTALVREACDHVADERPELVVAKGSSPAGVIEPYAAFQQAFEALPGGDTLHEEIEAARSSFAPGDPQKVRAQRTALFNDVADELRSISTDQPVVLVLENLQWADETTLALFAHLATTVDEWVYPLALVCTYRESTLAGTPDAALTDVLERVGREAAYTEVTLEPLSRTDTRTLLADVVGQQRLPEPFVDLMYDHTGGNPLFVRETATHLLEAGHVDPGVGAYPEDTDAVTLPAEVTEQVDQRLRTLDEASLELLRLGAVLGERVPGRVLAAASDLPPARHREYVDVLVAGRIWTRIDEDVVAPDAAGRPEPTADGDRSTDQGTADGDRSTTTDTVGSATPTASDGGTGDLEFVSGGLREAVVDRLSDGLAREYHARVADAFVGVYGDDSDPLAARVAHHYERAGRHERAVEQYRRAGDHATATYAHEDALGHYERAAALARDRLDDGATVASVEADRAEVHRTVGQYDEAREAVEEGLAAAPDGSAVAARLLGIRAGIRTDQGEFEGAREAARRRRILAADRDDREQLAEATRQLGVVARELDEYDEARDRLEEAREVARECGDRETEATVLTGLGTALFRQGDVEGAREQYERALTIARDLGDRKVEGNCLNNLGTVAYRQGDYERARDYYEQALESKREIGDRWGEARALNNLGAVTSDQGDYEESLRSHERSLDIKREIGDRQGEAVSLTNLAAVSAATGEFDLAREYNEQALDIAREVGDRQREALTLDNLAGVAHSTDDLERAREQYEESLAIARDIGDRHQEADSRKGLGAVATERGDHEAAEEHLGAALELFEEMDDDVFVAECRLALARLALEREELDRAREAAEQALSAFDREGVAHRRGVARQVLGAVEEAAGSPAEARDHWETAVATFEDVGAPDELLETLEELVESYREQGDDEAALAWCRQARDVLAHAPDATADQHREWVRRHAAALGEE